MVNEKYSRLFDKALIVASTYHEGQRRWNNEPFIMHSIRAMMYVIPNDNSQPTNHQLKVGSILLLHDVVEDTKLTMKELKTMFPLEITDVVELLTKKDYPENATEEEKRIIYWDYIKRISKNKDAIECKLADLKDNMTIIGIPKDKKLIVQRLEKYREAYHFLNSLHFK